MAEVRGVSDARTVPVQEDLTTEEDRLSVIRGLETMHRVDYPYEDAVEFELGDWGVLNANGRMERATTTAVPNTYLLFTGTDRYDVKATGQVTAIQNSGIVAKTTRYNADTYAPGDALTVKDWGAGESYLGKQAGSEPVLGRVVSEANGTLTFESVRS